MIDFGKRVVAARTARNMTQQRLAERLHMRPAQLCKIECGRGSPSIRTVERIAKALDIEISALLAEAGHPIERNGNEANCSAKAAVDGKGEFDFVAIRKEAKFELLNKNARHAILETEQEYAELECKRGLPSGVAIQLAYPLVEDERGAEAIARAMRSSLGAGCVTFADLAGLLEFRNVRLHAVAMPQGLSSISLYSTKRHSLSIILDKQDTPERQTYRIAYELGAACLFASRGYEPLEEGTVEHRFARCFASAFLMPEEAVRMAVAQTGIPPDGWTLESLCTLKARFNVSAEAFALRLENLGLIVPSLRENLRDSLRAYYLSHPRAMEPRPNLAHLPPNPRLEILRLRLFNLAKGSSKGNK